MLSINKIRLLEIGTENYWKGIGLGCVLFLSIGYVVFLKPICNQYQAITRHIAFLKQDLKFKNNQLIALQRALASYRLLDQSSVRRIKPLMLDEILNNVINICGITGVDMDSYRLLAEKKHLFYLERSMSFVLQATIPQLLALFTQIKLRKLPVSFHDFVVFPLDLNPMNKKVVLRLHMKSYQFASSQQSLQSMAVLKHKLFTHPLGNHSLAHVSLDCLYFVGMLRQDKTVWALIKKPDGSIARVLPGDFIGQEHAKIILITEKLVRIQENAADNDRAIQKIMTLHLK